MMPTSELSRSEAAQPSNAGRSYVNLTPGDPAPWFRQRATSNPDYVFDTVAGRYVVLCFYATAGDALGRGALQSVLAARQRFDDTRFSFFGISLDPADEAEGRAKESLPGIRFFWDFNGAVSRLYGAVPKDAEPSGKVEARRFWLVLDPTLRVVGAFPFATDDSNAGDVFAFLDRLPPPERFAGIEVQAPILFLPNVFEAEFCDHLVGLYHKHGGQESGFMREVGGKTVMMADPAHKRRKDYNIADSGLIQQIQTRIIRRISPEILKAYSFKATRMERYIVSCYSSEDNGHFRAHRDNTTKGTAHRRFAVSINLNAEFEGGEVSFPEYGPRSFKPPKGGAVVFPCALLHAVSHVTSGQRYAFLPFIYDEEAAKIREANNEFLGDNVKAYKAGTKAG
jgi:peroxiredoxin/predicted 2-oxoglutarate/Fe(II)-dependent dioxygenase YbiX